MTTTTNGHRPDVTVRGDVHMRVRASEIPSQAADRPDPASNSAYTRAISQETDNDQSKTTSNVRDFVSLHKGAVEAAATTSWFGREQPPALYDVAGDVFPAKGSAGGWAAWLALAFSGVLRLAGLSLVYLAAFCFTTRIRATTSTATIAAVLTIHAVLN